MFTFFFILNYYLQSGLHFGIAETSLVFLPLGLGFFTTSLLSSRIVQRWGAVVLKTGMLTMGASLFILIWSLRIDAVHLFHWHRITSYNVCYTKLLRVRLGNLQADGSYNWIQPIFYPPVLLDLKWHVVNPLPVK